MFKRKPKELDWEFIGKKLGVQLSANATMLAEQQTDNDTDGDLYSRLVPFNIALFFVVADRYAFNHLNGAQRKEFSDAVIQDSLSRFYKEKDRKKVVKTIGDYIDLFIPFSEVLTVSGDDNPKGSLFWEYSKMLDKKFGLQVDKAIESYAYSAAYSNLLLTELDKIIKEAS